MIQRSYLDYNATAPLRPEVHEAFAAALSLYGNPSSVHEEGRAARAAIEEARAKVAALVGARPEDVIFTSGGTEANALALAAQAGEAWHCYMSAVEHPSVLAGGRFYRETTTLLPVDKDGLADLEILGKELANLVESADVARGVRARGLADRRLVHEHDVVDQFRTNQTAVRAGRLRYLTPKVA